MKAQDFNDWCKVAEMMKEKQHLTEDGLEKIKKKSKLEWMQQENEIRLV